MNMNIPMKIPSPSREHAAHLSAAPHQQRGAVLFVSLMLLIILTLLGLSAAQVVTLQERMASSYRSDMLATQNADDLLADVERRTSMLAGNNAEANLLCENLYLGTTIATEWRDGVTTLGWRTGKDDDKARYYIENLAKGGNFFPQTIGSQAAGTPSELGDKNCLFLQVSARGYDKGANDSIDCGFWDTSDCTPPADTTEVIIQSLYTP